ncbi:hypothetical protein L0V05_12305 [Tabrizicola sp. J26]|uniref:BTAD domain-containing putative transcriptional regulator n=1 Tax=Alitabrizicola rongguiensis TaxID=2909234 RepID=UPI001F46EE2D|nr:BTAD domain-containing putative transcriptional regulator [Tabrizicola rongguiensis]MCF1709597.1 hypothetical protein [Tabrizicola rongguiensis]
MSDIETGRRTFGQIPSIAFLPMRHVEVASGTFPSSKVLGDRAVPRRELRLELFGGPRLVRSSGQTIQIAGRKGLAIVVYLSRCKGMTAPRDRLADLLWSDRDGDHARNSLRQSLAVLRREMSSDLPDLIRADREMLSLDAGLLDVDAELFGRLVATGRDEDIRAALDLAAAPFLEGFLSGSAVFDRWAEGERDKLMEMAAEAKAGLARRTGGEEGLALARDLLASDETREDTHRLLMELYARAGQRDRALKQYQFCRDVLRREFDVSPSAETEALRRDIAASVQPIARPELSELPVARAPSQAESTEQAVMVLDFVNLSGEGKDQFASVLVEDIIIALLHQREIRILSENLHRSVPGTSSSGEVSSRYVLSGSVQRSPGRIRVNAQLTDAVAGLLLWAERFDGSDEDLAGFQESVAHSIALAVRIDLMLTRWNVRDRTPPDDARVRMIVQRAFVKYYEMTQESLTEAVRLAEQALQLEPASLRGMRTLSLAISGSMAQGVLPKTVDNMERAMRLALKAVEAVPDDEMARLAYAWSLSNLGRHAQAAAELRHTIELNPDFPTPYSDLAEQYAYLGLRDEALAMAQRAFTLSSHDIADFWRHYSVVVAQFSAGEDHAALDGARRICRSKPGFVRAGLFRAAAAAALGDLEEATSAIESCLGVWPDLTLRNVAPGFMPRYVEDAHHQRFIDMLRLAGLPDRPAQPPVQH